MASGVLCSVEGAQFSQHHTHAEGLSDLVQIVALSSCVASSTVFLQGTKPSWAARIPTWSPATRMHMNHLMDLFTICDKVSSSASACPPQCPASINC